MFIATHFCVINRARVLFKTSGLIFFTTLKGPSVTAFNCMSEAPKSEASLNN